MTVVAGSLGEGRRGLFGSRGKDSLCQEWGGGKKEQRRAFSDEGRGIGEEGRADKKRT